MASSRTEQIYKGFTLRNRSHRYDGWHVSHNGRVRWGTLPEIKADVDHVLVYGYLPCERRSWA